MIQQNIKTLTLGEQQELFFEVLDNLNNSIFIRDTSQNIKSRAESITAFLKDIMSPDGTSVPDGKVSISYNFNGRLVHKIFSTKKIQPKRKSTVTLGESSAYVGDLSNVYINLPIYYNTITKEHTEKNISHLYCIGLDIDDFSLSHFDNDSQKIAAIFENYPFFKLFPPNKIVDSGNKGFHVYYLFTTNLYNNIIKVKEVSKAISLIINADATKTNANNKLRLPFTLNIDLDANQSREPKLSTIIYNNPNRYNFYQFMQNVKTFIENSTRVMHCDKGFLVMDNNFFEEMKENNPSYVEDYISLEECQPTKKYILDNTDFFKNCIDSNKKYGENFLETGNTLTKYEQYKKKTTDDSRYTIKTYYRRALLALDEVLKSTNGRLTGVRNNYLHIYAVVQKQLNFDEETILSNLINANNNFSESLPASQVKAIWRCVTNHKYQVSALDIKEMLDLDDDFLKRYNIAATKEERKAKKRTQNKKLAELRKKQRNTKAKKYKQISLVKKLLKKSIAKKQIIQMLSISRSTLYRIIKILGISKNKFRYDYESLKKTIKKCLKTVKKLSAKFNVFNAVKNIQKSVRANELFAVLC